MDRWPFDGNPYVQVNDFYSVMMGLSEWTTDELEHSVEYELGSAVSNKLIVKAQRKQSP
jgi:hypothetical protein